MKVPVPSIGRIVHYVSGSFDTYPAIVVEVNEAGDPYSRLGLMVATVRGPYFAPAIKYSPNGAPASWHWPPYVPPVEVEA